MLSKNELQMMERQFEIADIIMKDEKDVTEEEVKKVQDYLEELDETNKDDSAYTLEELENMVNDLIKELENEKISCVHRKKCNKLHNVS